MDADSPRTNNDARQELSRDERPFPWTEILSAACFHRDPEVLEGSTIVVMKNPAELPKEKKEFDLGATIKDSFAIVASAATIICLVSQLKK